jgi:hypothetical protein
MKIPYLILSSAILAAPLLYLGMHFNAPHSKEKFDHNITYRGKTSKQLQNFKKINTIFWVEEFATHYNGLIES